MSIRSSQESQSLPSPNSLLSLLKPHWNKYFTSVAPLILDHTLPLHQTLLTIHRASTLPLFPILFPLSEHQKHFHEITLNYGSISRILSQEEEAKELLELLRNFQFEAAAVMPSICLVMHHYLIGKQKKEKKVCLLVENYPLSDITEIRAHMIENFITIEAVVLKVYQIKLMPVSMNFQCTQCKATFTHQLLQGNFTIPARCRAEVRQDCRSKSFFPLKHTVKTIFAQRFKVQEIDSEGRNPRQVFCETRENMVGKVITGETLRLSGLIKTETLDEKDKKTQGIFIPFILVNSVLQRLASRHCQHDMVLISSMRQNEHLFYSLIKSFCPTIFGHELVKAGLLLSTIGGSSKSMRDQSTFRETSHVLLLGDPGIGKSQLLKFSVEMLPHSVYVNATACSTSGLTVTVNKDGNEQSLEAGALILADNGVCAIDEFDKAADNSALLEVMEQQTISIAKAGIICQLKCRVGIIASANPVNGCYNKGKSFKENTKISNAILSRFDLIFLLVDRPDPQRDRKLSEHIMKIHNKPKKRNKEDSALLEKEYSKYDNYLSLTDKYGKMCEGRPVYSLQEIKKYLTYVKSEVHPTLSRSACEVIKGFYLTLRDNNLTNSFQITTRQLQSLVRLSMARARLECRNQVTEEDAVEVTQLMQESLFDSFEEMGYNVNALRQDVKKSQIAKKTGELSLPKQRNIFINALKDQSKLKGSCLWEWGDMVKTAKELELSIGDFYNFIERLNQDGVLLQKGNKKYMFQNTFL